MGASATTPLRYRLDNPLAPAPPAAGEPTETGVYAQAIELGLDLLERPKRGGGPERVRVQHAKQRMTVFERIMGLDGRFTRACGLRHRGLTLSGDRLSMPRRMPGPGGGKTVERRIGDFAINLGLSRR